MAELGGLYVIGMNRHESRRIDHQLRGRAGRQGDPGRSRFFISREDDLLVKYGIGDARVHHDAESIQRLVEGQNLEIRRFLAKYEAVIEGQRQRIQERRQRTLTADTMRSSESVELTTIDDLWSDHLAAVARIALRRALVFVGRARPAARVPDARRHDVPGVGGRAGCRNRADEGPTERGATWTYLTTDRPFGNYTERILKALVGEI